MAAPMARQAVQLQVEGELVSVPYVTMTARMMSAFGLPSLALLLDRSILHQLVIQGPTTRLNLTPQPPAIFGLSQLSAVVMLLWKA